jgi:hypothetical protein
MNKLWVGSLYYFLNVLLHLGIFGVLFFVSSPDNLKALDYFFEFWHSAEGREIIILNTSLLLANLFFALSIIFLAPRATIVLVTMAFIACTGLVLAYLNDLVGLLAYAAGAIHLSFFSFNKFKIENAV